MHIAEGFLPPLHAAAWYVAAVPFVIHGARAVIIEARKSPENKLLLAAAGAFTAVLSAIKLPSVTGSSSHPTGTGMGAILFRPPVMAFMGTLVLLFQAVLLAHGGLSTLGANTFSFAIVGPWVAYGIHRGLQAVRAPEWATIFTAVAVANIAIYSTTSLQLALAHPDPVTGIGGALVKFLGIFAVTQVPISIVEGIIAVLILRQIFRYVAREKTGSTTFVVKEAAHV